MPPKAQWKEEKAVRRYEVVLVLDRHAKSASRLRGIGEAVLSSPQKYLFMSGALASRRHRQHCATRHVLPFDTTL